MQSIYKAPFPYFGGKSKVAQLIWERFGSVTHYIEPFFGSGAVLLGRPLPFSGVETINDKDGLVSNFWRALQTDPEAVAQHADYPVFENDLHARHVWLVGQTDSLQERLEGDPNWFDTKIAGWWVWGISSWLGGEFRNGKGPWRVVEDAEGTRRLVCEGSPGQGGRRQRVNLSSTGCGVRRTLVDIGSTGRGVHRQRVRLSSTGCGVHRPCVPLSDAGRHKPGCGDCGLLVWFQLLSERLRRVRVCCGDWRRVCGGKSGNALSALHQNKVCAVFLDPPYADTAHRESSIYRVDSLSVAHEVRQWALAHGDDPRIRICLAGYEDEHEMPSSWNCVPWKTCGGMALVGKKQTRGKTNRFKERLWFSPHCLHPVAPKTYDRKRTKANVA